jgi:hypothetical protein
VSDNRVLRRTFGSKGEKVARRWTRLHIEELYNLCTSSSIIRVMKSRRIRWIEYVARMVDLRNAHIILVGKLEWKT